MKTFILILLLGAAIVGGEVWYSQTGRGSIYAGMRPVGTLRIQAI